MANSLTYPADLTSERSVIFSAFTPSENIKSVSALGSLIAAGSAVSGGIGKIFGVLSDLVTSDNESLISSLGDNVLKPIKNTAENFWDSRTGTLAGSGRSDYGSNREVTYETSVILPMSPSFAESLSHRWTHTDMLEATESVYSALSSLGGSYIGDFAKGMTLLTAVNKFRNVASEMKMHGAEARITGKRNLKLNPGYFANYDGSDFRTFSFKFDFLPQSQSEAKTVLDIIRVFKAYSCPKSSDTGSGSDTDYMEEPHLWTITVGNQTVNDMLAIGYCVCTGVEVSYGESSELLLFKDGMPKQISLNVIFMETDPRFEQHFIQEGSGEANRFKIGNLKSYEVANNPTTAQKDAAAGNSSGETKVAGTGSADAVKTPTA